MNKFNLTQLKIILHYWLLLGLLALVSGCAMNLQYVPYQKKSELNTLDNSRSLEITFLGNTTLYFESKDGNKNSSSILIDGFVSRPTLWPMLMGLDYQHPSIQKTLELAEVQLDQNDYIIPLHSHYDHLLDAPYIAYYSGAKLLASPTTAFITGGIEKSLQQTARQNGEVERSIHLENFTLDQVTSRKAVYSVGEFEVTLEKATHNDAGCIAKSFAPLCNNCVLNGDFSEKQPSKEFKEGITVNVHIDHKATDKKIYVMGGIPADDTRCPSKASEKLNNADIVFLTIPVLKGLLEEKPPKWSQFFKALASRPKMIVPVHWDFFLKKLDLEKCNSNDLSHCLLAMPHFRKTMERLNKEVCANDQLTIKWLTGFSTLSVRPETNFNNKTSEEVCEY